MVVSRVLEVPRQNMIIEKLRIFYNKVMVRRNDCDPYDPLLNAEST